jgi:leucine dehydrogenase
MDLFDRLNEHDYEKLVFVNDGPAGLRGIIAIHDTTLGPARRKTPSSTFSGWPAG